ncbi:hypothetical protein HYH02_010374 [Chlamydomonas schloesseri]|uniref:Uncharacterized protein n=1 Tax=Chlamydomonas schloesseri TaxID=2026947 RepID=A0A835TKX8_9CHLO|nr:hypothetical protein HYH02_010374 [Chlamydomonas schloesseri]|eukprot:KAG2440496.1 hypothetical protein HYH02_010374 [Chlamydomonas schloesseri]
MEHFVDVSTSGPSEESILEQTYRLEAYLKGQGYVGSEVLNLLSPSTSQAQFVIDLLFQMAQQQSNDRGAREELRDQANKERVAANVAQKKLESQEETIRKLQARTQECEGKLLAQKHSYEEKLATLKRDLKSTQLRLNALLPGGSKEATVVRRGGGGTASTSTSGGGAAGPGGARRVAAPTYDRFHDDPSDTMQRLEADVSRLRLANDKLKRELAAAREQAARREEPAAASPREGTSSQSHSVGGASRSPTSPDPEVARLQRRDREMQLTLDHLRQQLNKAVEERSELHKTLHSLRQKNISLDQERRNFEDRFLRAQKANAALQPGPSAAELLQQMSELRVQAAAAAQDAQEANARVASLEGRLAAAEAAEQSNKRYVEVLKRSMQLAKGPDMLEAVQRTVEELMAPAHQQLQQLTAELAEARQQAAAAAASTLRSADSLASASASCAGGAAGGGMAAATAAGAVATDSALPLSPAGLQPVSPTSRFDGFAPGPLPNSGSPPLLQPPPAHAFYNRSFAATMPSPHSERMLPSCPEQGPSNLEDAEAGTEGFPEPGAGGISPSTSQPMFGGGRMRSSPHLHFSGTAVSHGGGFGGGFGADSGGFGQRHGSTSNTGEVGPFASEAGGFATGPSPAHWRRSLSAGPVRNLSTERQRPRWQLEHTAQAKRWPSPADILLHQARSGDGTISISDGAGAPLQL